MNNENLSSSYGNKKERKGREKLRQRRHSPGDHTIKNNGNVYNLSWSPQRMFQNSDPPFTSFPIVGIPVETYQPLPMYQSIFSSSLTSPPMYPTPPLRKNRKNNSRRSLPGDRPRMNDQEYASLPPVNCDAFSDKSSDSDTNSKRHFSDPGLGQASSDESHASSKSSPVGPLYVLLLEEVRDLKDSRQKMAADLTTLRDEVTELKMKTCSHCLASEYQPGSLSDVVGELRKAAQMREEAMLAKLDVSLETSNAQLREMLMKAVDRINALELKLERTESGKIEQGPQSSNGSVNNTTEEKEKLPVIEKLVETSVPDAFRMLHSLEQEKKQLVENLKEAVAGRNEAEANTKRLERLVAILRTKINGLSTETTLAEENGRTATNSFERNPFIIMDSLGKVSSENHNSDNRLKGSLTDSKNEKSSPPLASKKSNPVSSTAANPLVPTKPNFSHLPKPAPKPANNCNRSGKMEGSNTKSSSQSAKFAVGKVVTSTHQKNSEQITDSSTDSLINSLTALPASITITGPVTDL